MKYKLIIAAIMILMLSFSLAYAKDPKPVLYGEVFNGAASADGAIVTVYPEANPLDNLSDVVGITGNTKLEGYWKTNLYNLITDVNNGDKIVVYVTDGQNTTQRYYAVNSADGAVKIDLNFDTALQDYDDDGSLANADCDDQNPLRFPGNSEVCGNGIDEDCSGSDAVCPTVATTSGGGGGGGGGASYGNWTCTEWSACSPDNIQTRICTNSLSQYMTAGKPAESQKCTYVAPAGPGAASFSPVTSEPESPGNVVEETTGETTDTQSSTQSSTTDTQETSGITGAIIAGLAKPSVWMTILAVMLIGGIGYAGYFYLYKKN